MWGKVLFGLMIAMAAEAALGQSAGPPPTSSATDMSACASKQDDKERLACFDAATRKPPTLPPCAITDAEARQDGERLVKLLQQGSPKFLTDWDTYYGSGNAPKFCATRSFIETMAAVDPEDVIMTPDVGPLEVGVIHGGFYRMTAGRLEIQGYEINLTKIACGAILESLKYKQESPLVTTATIRRMLKKGDARKFVTNCSARNSTKFRFVLDENGNVEVQ
jgi:hypothetical protein